MELDSFGDEEIRSVILFGQRDFVISVSTLIRKSLDYIYGKFSTRVLFDMEKRRQIEMRCSNTKQYVRYM